MQRLHVACDGHVPLIASCLLLACCRRIPPSTFAVWLWALTQSPYMRPDVAARLVEAGTPGVSRMSIREAAMFGQAIAHCLPDHVSETSDAAAATTVSYHSLIDIDAAAEALAAVSARILSEASAKLPLETAFASLLMLSRAPSSPGLQPLCAQACATLTPEAIAKLDARQLSLILRALLFGSATKWECCAATAVDVLRNISERHIDQFPPAAVASLASSLCLPRHNHALPMDVWHGAVTAVTDAVHASVHSYDAAATLQCAVAFGLLPKWKPAALSANLSPALFTEADSTLDAIKDRVLEEFASYTTEKQLDNLLFGFSQQPERADRDAELIGKLQEELKALRG